MKAFPKIWTAGTRHVADIFDGPVEVTEKVDGSQFGFGKTPDGEFVVRSRGQVIDPENAQKQFKPAIEHVQKYQDLINPDTMYYGEVVTSKKHNTLAYESLPRGYIALFAAGNFDFSEVVNNHEDLQRIAEQFGIDCTPLLFAGNTNREAVNQMLGQKSFLGGANIEGVVVKRYGTYSLRDETIPLRSAKIVSAEFQEKHTGRRSVREKGEDRWQAYLEDFRTEARWRKAVEHLRDSGELDGCASDIGPLLREVHHDIDEEYKDEIMEKLWQLHKKDVYQTATRGFAVWYKDYLLSCTNNSPTF